MDPTESQPTQPAQSPERTCANCGERLRDGQDWCLQCGTGAPGSLDMGGPGWRSATTVLAITALLVLGAGAAAYAALTRPGPARPVPRIVTVAQAPVTPAIPPTTPTTPTTPGALGTPTTVKPLPSTTPPPKIPLTAPTPSGANTGANSSPTTSTPGTGAGETNTGTTPSKASGGAGAEPEQPNPILLDTNAASTYNPYGYPASDFGDPSLAIDGETSTAWTAQVDPTVAPRLAEGLAIDLKSPQHVGSVTLITSTPGMTVQVYGSVAGTLPTSITDPAWTVLSPSLVAKKRKTHITLRDARRSFRFIALWISRAPQSAVGTPAAPGHVAVNELELFAPTAK